MWNLKNKTNKGIKQNRNRLTDIENKLVVTKEEREGEGQDRSLGLADTDYYV